MTQPDANAGEAWRPSARFQDWRGCNFCKHLDWSPDAPFVRCKAYPDAPGIPFLISAGQSDHMVERPGQVSGVLYEDNGLSYEQMIERFVQNPHT